MKTTIKDVARAAGVAPSTVSNYLTGHARVSPRTGQRIQEAIDTLGYIPNLAARSLRMNVTKTIGLLVPDIANPFYAEIIRAISRIGHQYGYSLLLGDSETQDKRETELLANLLSQRVDGVLMIHSGLRDDYGQMADQATRPIVFIDRAVTNRRSIVTDNRLGGQLAARHLLDLGHTRLGVLAGDPHVHNVQERLEGFRAEVEACGLYLHPEHIITGPQALETGRLATRLLDHHDPPSAIFATNDIIALGAWRLLTERGVRIPDDVSLIGYDNIDMTEFTVPSLTTVAQRKGEMGRQAVLALLAALRQDDDQRHTTYVTPELVARRSTGPFTHTASTASDLS